MNYYLIVGEASGDLHASQLMKELKKQDPKADFRFFGGDKMAAVGGVRVKHYRELAYMGFVPVLLHLRTIFSNMALCKRDLLAYKPDVVILVDYPGFNLSIAKFLRKERLKAEKAEGSKAYSPQVCYYISPKIWAWKEHRIKNIKRDIDKLYSILPFEVPFFEEKHGYKIDYVGNPTAQEVREFKANYAETKEEFCLRHGLDPQKEIIAVLPGSRKQEIRDNLGKMLEAITLLQDPAVGEQKGLDNLKISGKDFQIVIAQAQGFTPDFYRNIKFPSPISIHSGALCGASTYQLLSHSYAALVVSGTATLETALFHVPQVVVYETGFHWLFKTLRRFLLKVKWVSLVNLIANREVVPEHVADTCTAKQIASSLAPILDNTPKRSAQLDGYNEVWDKLGEKNAPEEAARLISTLPLTP